MTPGLRAPALRIAELGAVLRHLGVGAGPDAQVAAVRAAAAVDIEDAEDVRLALRCAYAHSPAELQIFDAVYPLWLRGERLRPEPGAASAGGRPGADAADEIPLPGGRRTAGGAPASLAAYSPAGAAGRGADVRTSQERAARRDADRFLRALRTSPGRRRRPGRRGALDLRRSARDARSTAGEVLRLRRRERRPRPPRVVLLCDFSRSMAEADAAQLRLARALVRRSRRVEVFAFSTELRPITERLRRPGLRPLRDLGLAYGGGTRIGASLGAFLRDFGARLRDRDSVVVVVSDGLDTGEPALVAQTLAQLRLRVRRLFWLSPLAGTPGYRPVQRALAEALPYLDGFGDALSPTALQDLAQVRPGRDDA